MSLGTVLSMKPQVLLLDEPTTDLDERNRERIIDIIKGLSASYIILLPPMTWIYYKRLQIPYID